jgi:intraflagellar transport protein 172
LQLASVDLNSALLMYAERGDWERALETAAEHGNDVLQKYVALCATQRIRESRATDALQVKSP